MEVRIGVQHAPRELVIESTETPDEVIEAVQAALTGEASVLTLSRRARPPGPGPADKLAYVEIGEPETRRVGFGSL